MNNSQWESVALLRTRTERWAGGMIWHTESSTATVASCGMQAPQTLECSFRGLFDRFPNMCLEEELKHFPVALNKLCDLK